MADATQAELDYIEAGVRKLVKDWDSKTRLKFFDGMIEIHTKWNQPKVVALHERLRAELAGN